MLDRTAKPLSREQHATAQETAASQMYAPVCCPCVTHFILLPSVCCRYGYANFRYVSSLISGVGIFCVGAGFAWYHGIAGILTKTELVDMTWVSVGGKPLALKAGIFTIIILIQEKNISYFVNTSAHMHTLALRH